MTYAQAVDLLRQAGVPIDAAVQKLLVDRRTQKKSDLELEDVKRIARNLGNTYDVNINMRLKREPELAQALAPKPPTTTTQAAAATAAPPAPPTATPPAPPPAPPPVQPAAPADSGAILTPRANPPQQRPMSPFFFLSPQTGKIGYYDSNRAAGLGTMIGGNTLSNMWRTYGTPEQQAALSAQAYGQNPDFGQWQSAVDAGGNIKPEFQQSQQAWAKYWKAQAGTNKAYADAQWNNARYGNANPQTFGQFYTGVVPQPPQTGPTMPKATLESDAEMPEMAMAAETQASQGRAALQTQERIQAGLSAAQKARKAQYAEVSKRIQDQTAERNARAGIGQAPVVRPMRLDRPGRRFTRDVAATAWSAAPVLPAPPAQAVTPATSSASTAAVKPPRSIRADYYKPGKDLYSQSPDFNKKLADDEAALRRGQYWLGKAKQNLGMTD